jgi:hypothetical protein
VRKPDGVFHKVGDTEKVKNTLNPTWKPWSVKLSKIAPDGDFFLDILIKVG